MDCSTATEAAPPLHRDVFDSETIRIGTFRARPSDPRFENSGPINEHIFVFPHAAVWIEHPSAPRFVADQNTVTFYNKGETYRRGAVDPRGDDSVWIAPSSTLLAQVLEGFDIEFRSDAPFAWHKGLVGSQDYLLHAALIRYLAEGRHLDPLVVEEAGVGLLGRVVARRATLDRPVPSPRESRHQDLAEATKAVIDRRYAEALTVADLASMVECSPFHLSRLFSQRIGLPIHAYRNQIRLRVGLLRLADADDLSDLALDLGFSSHSHFTFNFTQAFGKPPSSFRQTGSRDLARLVRKLHPSIRR